MQMMVVSVAEQSEQKAVSGKLKAANMAEPRESVRLGRIVRYVY